MPCIASQTKILFVGTRTHQAAILFERSRRSKPSTTLGRTPTSATFCTGQAPIVFRRDFWNDEQPKYRRKERRRKEYRCGSEKYQYRTTLERWSTVSATASTILCSCHSQTQWRHTHGDILFVTSQDAKVITQQQPPKAYCQVVVTLAKTVSTLSEQEEHRNCVSRLQEKADFCKQFQSQGSISVARRQETARQARSYQKNIRLTHSTFGIVSEIEKGMATNEGQVGITH